MDFSAYCFIIVIGLMTQQGSSLRCFQCSSAVGGYCDKPLDASKAQIQECSSQHNLCAILNVTSNGNSEIRRECADAMYCSQTRSKRQISSATSFARSCTTCSWNLCNSSPNVAPSFGIGIAGLILVKYYF